MYGAVMLGVDCQVPIIGSRNELTKCFRNAGVWIAEAMSAAAKGEAEGTGWDVKGEIVIELGAGE